MGALLQHAIKFAIERHAQVNHKRKYTGNDYIEHPRAVAGIVSSVGRTVEQVAAAWIHDTVEDTNTTLGEIYTLFGEHVGKLVYELTDVSKKQDGNRKIRKLIERTSFTCN